MKFDQWIDAVDADVRARLGAKVRTAELSWDSAMWVSGPNTAVAQVGDDEADVTLSFDGGRTVNISTVEAPAVAAEAIATNLVGRN